MARPHLEDPRTAEYFESHAPEYSAGRVASAVDALERHVPRGAALAEVGCGVGNVLAILRDRLDPSRLCGIDPSRRCLDLARERAGCETSLGSILDDAVVDPLAGAFDGVLLSAVIHHLVASTRAGSRTLAEDGVRNSLRLLAPGGRLVILEPVFWPRRAMDAVFHVKRAVTRLTSRRVGVLGRWNNIGAPVVSYLSHEELEGLVRAAGGTILDSRVDDERLSPILRLAGITRRATSMLVVMRA